MATTKTHPIYEALRNLEDAISHEVTGQLRHASEGEFSSTDAHLKAVIMAGNFAKALTLLREAQNLIPRTYEDYFADARPEGKEGK